MSESGGMLDAYLIAQALGWDWNFNTMIILSLGPILVIGLIFVIIFVVIPFILELIE